MKNIIIILLVFLCTKSQGQNNNNIYQIVLEDYVFVKYKVPKKTRLVIVDSTSKYCKESYPPNEFKYIKKDSSSFAEFYSFENDSCAEIALNDLDFKNLNKGIKYHFLANYKIGSYFQEEIKTNKWVNFRKKEKVDFGIVRFSTIYYSKNGKYACLNLSHSCDSLCGQGVFYTLYFDGQKWVIFDSYTTWVS
ncbi:MAG TPA: hypothetical protein VK177_04535 [Flavobacteriales bacterium]|nr:hypothetical protein [Flavobacteriales bacterium]